jgi:hypothetical protein
MEAKHYFVNIYSITGNMRYKSFYLDCDEAFNKYKKEVKRLKHYKIISKIELLEVCNDDTNSNLLESVDLHPKININRLSFFCYRKLYELFECITYGISYYREGEGYSNAPHELDRKEEFLTRCSLANAEYDRLLKQGNEYLYRKVKGSKVGGLLIKLEKWIFEHIPFASKISI